MTSEEAEGTSSAQTSTVKEGDANDKPGRKPFGLAVDRTFSRLCRPGGTSPVGVAAFVSWVSLGVFVVATLGSALLGRSVFLGTDLLLSVAPWRAALADTPALSNIWIGDTIDSGTPQTALIVDSLRSGLFAQWNPYQAGGTELSLPNSGAFSPLSLPWLFLPLAIAPAAVKLLESLVVTVGMSLLLRRFGLPSASWALASLVFLSSGFMVSWTNWPQTRVAALIPLLFWALDRSVVNRRAIDVIPVALTVASMLLGGFPAVTGYALYAGAAFVIVRGWILHRSWFGLLKAGCVSALGVTLGVLLSFWQIFPFALNALNVVDF